MEPFLFSGCAALVKLVLIAFLTIPGTLSAQVSSSRNSVIAAKAIADLQMVLRSTETADQIDVQTVAPDVLTTLGPDPWTQILTLVGDYIKLLDLRDPPPIALLIDDSRRNGYAAVDGSIVEPATFRHHGVILVGVRFTGRLIEEVQQRRNAAGVRAAIAHEMAHIYQFRHGIWTRLLQVEGNQSRRRAELHADFLCGWLLAQSKRVTIEEIDLVSRQLFGMGDLDQSDPHHHGTPGQRYGVMLRGFFLAIQKPIGSLKDASDEGEMFVNGMVPLPPEK